MASIDQAEGQPAAEPARDEGGQHKAKATTRQKVASVASYAFLAVPGAAGVLASWDGMSRAAAVYFDSTVITYAVPVAVDGFILGCGLRWVTAARHGRAAYGWRAACHAGVALTLFLNALAVWPDLTAVAWHVGGPLIWSAVVELLGRDMTEAWREEAGDGGRIPLRLWVTEPAESWRTRKRMWRTGERNAHKARIAADRCELALDRLGRVLVGKDYAADLATLGRRLAAGSVDPLDVLDAIESSRVESTESSRVLAEVLVERCEELALASGRVESTGESTQDRVESSEGESSESSRLAIESSPVSRVDSGAGVESIESRRDRVELDSPRVVVEPVAIESPRRPATNGRASTDGGVPPRVVAAAEILLDAWNRGELPRDVGAEPARVYLKANTEAGASWKTADAALKYLARQNGHTNGHGPS